MASKKKRPTRQTADYLLSVRRLSKYVPSLSKLKNRKSLTKSEKRRIRYREKQLNLGANIAQLHPLTAQQAKRVGSKKLFRRGIRAIQLRGVKPGQFKITKKGDIEVIAEEGRWVYWSLDRDTVRSRRGMRDAGALAFQKKFPIEIVADLTAKAFAQYDVQQVRLWAHAGIVGDPKESVAQFVLWVNEKWSAGRYIGVGPYGGDNVSDPGKWVNGIAILLEKPEYAKRRRQLERQAAKN